MVVASDAPIFQLYYTPYLTWLRHDGPLIIGSIQGKEYKTTKNLSKKFFTYKICQR